ncbi:phosphoserine phosphatase SerB [Phenylobacterium soli]|uniref:Phosphoserine phosphatase n=1 Tax=Phenylobacterium soli TaxID=2170551 RepID=A0A328APN9_9CAUL|nr:phosphoserine phosphatase SerB [Phenylobacterium soli]RAK56281.1 phosphoserine phosphatase SerB [Phenylobacterium soli]
MQLALTLVSPEPGAAEDALAHLASALAGARARVKEPRPLGPGAVDVALEAEDASAVREAAEGALEGRAVDVCVQPWNGRRKKLLVADMDSTIINVECLDELADFAGLKAHIAAITERAMRGELEFETALRERVALLRGLSTGALQQTYDERVRLNPGARTLVRTMAANGARCALVSGGFTFFTSRVAEAAGFHLNRANTLHEESGKLTGEVGEPILGREAKLRSLLGEAEDLKLPLSETLAVGDGANDLAMIEVAGLGVAYRAKPIVAAQADAKVDHADLTALLYYQGYRAAEFVTD